MGRDENWDYGPAKSTESSTRAIVVWAAASGVPNLLRSDGLSHFKNKTLHLILEGSEVRARELSESVWKALLALARVAFLFVEKGYDHNNAERDSSHRKTFFFYWFGAEVGAKTDESLLHSWTSIMTNDDGLFVKRIRERYSKMTNGTQS